LPQNIYRRHGRRIGSAHHLAIHFRYRGVRSSSLVPPTAATNSPTILRFPSLCACRRIIEVPMAPYSYYPMLRYALHALGVLGYDSVPKLIHLLVSLSACPCTPICPDG
jgi:hypothetical protein